MHWMLRPFLPRPAVHRDRRNAALRQTGRQLQRPLDVRENPYLTRDRHLQTGDQRAQNRLRRVRFGHQGRPHAALDRELFRTAHVDVDAGHVVLHQAANAQRPLRTAGAHLQDNAITLRGASSKDNVTVHRVDEVYRSENGWNKTMQCNDKKSGINKFSPFKFK